MPNHVTHKILFASDQLPEVLARIGDGDNFDFARLVPMPSQMYHGALSSEDEQDFSCNWLNWSRENWGTKWNAYDFSSGIEGDRAFLSFDTAWTVPYPVIAAFNNAFPAMPFEHRYFDEGHNFWGIETWSIVDGRSERVRRTNKRFKNSTDETPLCVELKGYDPATVDAEA
jgi:hypothetical protein